MKKEIELIGCPWCGKCPTVFTNGTIIKGVRCGNILCKIMPSTIGKDIDVVIQNWNNRINPKDEWKYILDMNL